MTNPSIPSIKLTILINPVIKTKRNIIKKNNKLLEISKLLILNKFEFTNKEKPVKSWIVYL